MDIGKQINKMMGELADLKVEYTLKAHDYEMMNIQLNVVRRTLMKDWDSDFIVNYLRNYFELMD